MKHYLFTLGLFLLAVGIDLYLHYRALPQIAVVDLPQVIAHSPKMRELDEVQNRQLDELEQWIDTSELEIKNEQDLHRKQTLIKQYEYIARQKRDLLKQSYEREVAKINAEISRIIKQVASAHNCDYIMLKPAVFRGGNNLTAEIIRNLPQ